MAHEALLSGNVITKRHVEFPGTPKAPDCFRIPVPDLDTNRNVYYQNPQLFKSQAVVDDMVDNLAFTLGVGREDLNIVSQACSHNLRA